MELRERTATAREHIHGERPETCMTTGGFGLGDVVDAF
jgi:hypothetical protein